MDESTSTTNLNESLNVLERESPSLNKLYTQICYCFSVPDRSSHSAIIDTLIAGLERLSTSFPWLAGQIINEGLAKGNPGTFKIKPMERIPLLVVKNYTHDPSRPTMSELRKANFPFSMLDESVIAPRNTISGDPEESAPVFILQANFIIGGLMLTFNGNHIAMDMVGQGHVIHLFTKACHTGQFTSEELLIGNISRQDLLPLLDDSYKPGPELAYQIVKPKSSGHVSEGTDTLSPTCSWAYFNFSSTSLITLKSLATKSITPSTSYISTDDALVSFIWQSIMRIRLPRLDPTIMITLARAVDVRRYLDIPRTYPGLMQNMTYHTHPLQEIISKPLGHIASDLRLAVDPQTSKLAYNTRALATVLNRSSDNKDNINFTAMLDLSSDIMLSSWANVTCYEDDFNLGLGKPEIVRRPRFTPVESLLYLMPKTLEGDIALAACLRDEDIEKLRGDEEFAKFGVYIG